jgi:hypothetical protein
VPIRHEQFGCNHQRFQRLTDLRTLIGIERESAALLDQRPRQGLGEETFGQAHIERLAASLVAGLILGRQRERDVGAGIGILAEVLDGLTDAVAGPDIRQHQRELRWIEQRPRLGSIGRFAGRKLRVRFGDAVVVLDLVGQLQRTARLAFRILGERNGRGMVSQRAEAPLRLARRRADVRGAIAGDGVMSFAGALGRLLGGRSLRDPTAHNDVEGTAAGAHDQLAAGRHRQWTRRRKRGLLVRCRQDDRRLSGIKRRRHPGIDPDIVGREYPVPVEGGRDANPSFVAGRDIGRDHQHNDQRAQRPGIVNRQPRRRQAGADTLDRGQGALALRLPQRQRDRVLRLQRVGQGCRRAVADAGTTIEPRQRVLPAWPAKLEQGE